MTEAMTLAEITDSAHVVSVPLVTPFRGVRHREALLFQGRAGWAEFSPFLDYDDGEASTWLRAAIDFASVPAPPALRGSIPVNAIVPAVDPDDVESVLVRAGNARTAKVKVAERGQTLADDIARVREVRQVLGPVGRIRVDANGAWNVDEAERAAHALAEFDLEYLEQPCARVSELRELRLRLHDWDLLVAADESIRKADDPLRVAREDAADLIVIKAQPLGGIERALGIVKEVGLPAVVSSAIDTSVGLSQGALLAAALPDLPFDCGLGTGALLASDIAVPAVTPRDGSVPAARVRPDSTLLAEYRVAADRERWWIERLERCYALVD